MRDILKRVLAIVTMSSVRPSVCLSWCLSQPGTDPIPGEADSGFSPCDSVESLGFFSDQISCRWVGRFPSNEGVKEFTP